MDLATGQQGLEQLKASSALAWVELNGFLNENGVKMEFDDHAFLMQPFTDISPDQVIKKSAQVGWSTLAIFRSFHLAKYRRMNIAHVLPTKNVVTDFVFPKVDPIISKNPAISEMVGVNSKTLKGVDGKFIYYRGSFTEREAITISTDLNIIDEYDRADQKILTIYDSRLQYSKFSWRWRFSNPSAIGFGVDRLYNDSDQQHWFIKCHTCQYEWFIDFASDGQCHYVDVKKKEYACGKCGNEITDQDRRSGRWVAKYPTRKRRGYWISQLMAPWVSAERIIEQQEESSIEFFHNFVLGKAYTPTDLLVDRAAIIRANSPSNIVKTNVAIGVDNGIVKHWVAGTPEGVFAYGKTESWNDIEKLLLMYNATMVIDANPYPITPKLLVEKYHGRVFVNYYQQDTKNLGIVRWGASKEAGVVKADRTKILDLVAQEIAETKLLFRQPPSQLEEYIYHWANMYRTVIENDRGIARGVWITQENRPDHLAHATVYMRIALSKIIGRSGGPMGFAEPLAKKSGSVDYVDSQGQVHTDLGNKVKQALENGQRNSDEKAWLYE